MKFNKIYIELQNKIYCDYKICIKKFIKNYWKLHIMIYSIYLHVIGSFKFYAWVQKLTIETQNEYAYNFCVTLLYILNFIQNLYTTIKDALRGGYPPWAKVNFVSSGGHDLHTSSSTIVGMSGRGSDPLRKMS